MRLLMRRDMRHSRRVERLGWVLVLTLTALLVISLYAGIRSLGAI